MAHDRMRLYVAVYPSEVENDSLRKYHWAFILGPRAVGRRRARGMCCHAIHPLERGWVYEQAWIRDVKCAPLLLARILIAKVEDQAGLLRILRETPLVQNDRSFTCRTWLEDALRRISEANPRVVGTSQLDWGKIEALSRSYVEEKHDAGRYDADTDASGPKPMWDMLSNKEVIP